MARNGHRIAPDHELTKFPSGIKYIIGNEGCERFSYYGMKAILFVYIVGLYINLEGFSKDAARADATVALHTFGAAVYALPMIGALIADRLLGKYRTILWLSMVYCLGHAALAIFEGPALQMDLFGQVLVDPMDGLFIGLGLIAVGSGGIKPCVSAHVGDQFGRGNWHLLEKVYNAFYFIINFGSAFATIFIPIIRGDLIEDPVTGHYHYDGSVTWAFAVPGLLMGLATFFFWLGRRDFVHVPPTHPGKLGLLDVLSGTALFAVMGVPLFIFMGEFDVDGWLQVGISAACFGGFVALFSLRQRIQQDDGFLAVVFYTVSRKLFGSQASKAAPGLFGPARLKWGEEHVKGPKAVIKIMSVFLMVAVFWALFHQHSSTWVAQARDMDRTFNMGLSDWLLAGGLLGLLTGVAVVLTLRKSLRGGGLSLLGSVAIGAGLAGLLHVDVDTALGLGFGDTAWNIIGIVLVSGLGLWLTRESARWVQALAILLGALLGVGLGLAVTVEVTTFEVQASQVPSVNPFMVMLLIPLATYGLYPLIEKTGIRMTPLRRMTAGMVTAAIAFASVALIQGQIDHAAESGEKITVLWQLLPYLIITLAEVMISITGLGFGYSQAPKRMKSVIMGFWLLMAALGDVIVVFFAGLKDLETVDFFWAFAGLMFLAAVLFGLRAAFYTYEDFTQ